MNLRNKITENIIVPLSDIVLGQSVYKHFKFLLKSQWWSEKEFKEYQNTKLRDLIKHSYLNVTYYEELFNKLKLKPDDFKTTIDLHKLPFLTKEIIRENINNGKLIARNIPKSQIVHCSSSGSTGEPLQYYTTKDALSFNNACGIRGWYWMGYRLGNKYVKISTHKRSILKKIQDLVNRSKYLQAKHLTELFLKNIAKSINSYHPKIIRGYPEHLLILAKYIKNNNLNIFSPTAISTTGSVLSSPTRNLIEKQFDCKIFDSYRCEGGAYTSECETRSCYHSSMEYAITEIISNKHEVKKGKKGRVITTDLNNYAVPFIRYDTQDYVTKSKSKCSCGRNLLAIDSIDGRDGDILITPNGKILTLQEFGGYLQHFDSIEQYQIIQDSINHIIIKLVTNNKFNKNEGKIIYNYWNNYIGSNVKLEIQIVDDISFTKSGKLRSTIRNKNIKLNM